jgi:hypothetical protein
MQRKELVTDDGIDKQPVRVRTGRMFLDGFAGIKKGQANLDLPIFAAMSPTDQVRQQHSSMASGNPLDYNAIGCLHHHSAIAGWSPIHSLATVNPTDGACC